MTDHKKSPGSDTDTLTLVDPTLVDEIADAATIKQHAIDPDASTHRLTPRVMAPLRVCPSCSRAWEVTGEWCPSCGTAFDVSASDAVTRVSDNATRVMPGRTEQRAAARAPRRRGQARTSNTRSSTGKQSVSARRAGGDHRPPRSASVDGRDGAGGGFKIVATIIAFSLALAFAFVLGQETRASNEEVDQQIAEAVQQTKDSAVASFEREFEQQRDRLQSEFNQRVKEAEAQAREQGRADAQAQNEGGGVVDTLERCLKNFLLEC